MGTILTSILYLSALSSFVYGQGLVWEPAPDLSVPRHEVAATVGMDGRIYAIGGWVGSFDLWKSVEAFDEGTQTWISNALPDLPVPRSSARAVTDSQGKIWVIGGGTTGSVILDTVVVYDPAHPAAGWQIQSAKLKGPRCYMGAVIDRFDAIYIFGGGDGIGVLNSAEKYDPNTGQWTSIASMHQPKYGIGYSMDGQGRIYAISGSNGIVDFATAERYDPATNTWERLQKSGSYEVLDYPHASCVSFCLNGKIWYVGGWNGGMLSDSGVYDPVADTWQRDSNQYPYLYEGRAGAASVVSKTGWVYIIGGQNYGGTATSHVARMKVKENIPCAQWRSGPNMSVTRHDAAIVQGKDNQIYAIGGGWCQMGSLSVAYDTVDVFDGVSWKISPDKLPAPRGGARGVVDSTGQIWVMGGGDPTSNTVLSYQPGSSSGWQTSQYPMNDARGGMGVAITPDDTIYAFGGANASGYLRSVEKSVRGGPWSQVAPMRDLRYYPGFVYHNGYIYAIGGQHTTVTLSSAERLNLATGQWEQLPPMPEAKSGPSAFVYHDEIYVVGGWNNYMTSSCFVLNPTTLQWRNESKAALYEGFTCGGSGIPYIVGGQRSAGYSSDHFSIVEWVLYETDFSTDPRWITDQPENFYWASAAQAYHFRGSNTQPLPYTPMNRYYGTELRLGTGSFVVEWDLYLTRLDWSAGIGFGLFDENRQMFGGQSVWVDFSSVDRGRITSLFVFGAEGQEVRSTDGGIVELNKRYSCRIAYDAPTRQVHYEIRIRRTGELVWSVSVTVPGGFTKDLRFLGGTREGVRPPYTGVNPSAISEGMIDNVRVTVITNPLLLFPSGGQRWISGTKQTIEWSACPSLTQVRLEYSTDNGQTWNPIGVVFNTGKFPWEVASVNSEECRVRVSNPNDPGQSAMSEAAFTIFVCQQMLAGDLNHDCYVTLEDLALFAESWLLCGNPFEDRCGVGPPYVKKGS